MEFTIVEYSHEEYLEDLRKELKADGIVKAVEKRMNDINHECDSMGYVQYTAIMESLDEIRDLIKLDKEGVE